MKKSLFIFNLLVAAVFARAQSGEILPVTLFHNSDTSRPFIMYICGDGGMNKFSTSFMQSFQLNGYAVAALDARSYFWKKKTPQQAANDVNKLTSRYLNEWKRKSFILLGYSFGADVVPFICNRLSANIQNRLKSIVLLSPSATTDFEIHLVNILGFNSNSGSSVPAEINKISKNVVFLFGSDEKDFPLKEVTIRNKQVITLPGGHHYEGDVSALSKQIISTLK
jgi:type IV secretory pathway VirJ component